MERRLFFCLTMAVVFVLTMASALGQGVPRMINYQGFLIDKETGAGISGEVTLTFRLYDARTEGNLLWEESQAVDLQDGVYNVLLGSSEDPGTLDPAIFDTQPLWLEVWVDGEPGPMTPRQRLTSVPFAIKAESSGVAVSIMNNTLTGDLFVGGNVGIGTDLPAEKLSVAGNVKVTGTGNGVVFADESKQESAGYSKAQIDALIATLVSRIADLESKLQGMTRVGGDIYFTGVNVHIRNGQSGTETKNGLGNLIIGYNEPRETGSNRNGSHNLVVGSRHNYSSYGGIVGDQENEISGPYANVTGGGYNKASGSKASVTGGFSNVASGAASCVSGGYGNETANNFSSISGGEFNKASRSSSSITGGGWNTTTGYAASISGGSYNLAAGDYSFIGGGGYTDTSSRNIAYAKYSAILGGSGNITGSSSDSAAGEYSCVSGGTINNAVALGSSITGGNNNKTLNPFASVSGGTNNIASGVGSSVTGGQYNKASGFGSFVAGGGSGVDADGNHAYANYSAILGGKGNFTGDRANPDRELYGKHSTVSGGDYNTASGYIASVSGGQYNIAGGAASSVTGGKDNAASGAYGSITGGQNNKAIGQYASVSGGGGSIWQDGNLAVGDYTAILGGVNNVTGDRLPHWDEELGDFIWIPGSDTTIGKQATISGGVRNLARGESSSVSGGFANDAFGDYSSISGGRTNAAGGFFSSVSGGWRNGASGTCSSVSGGETNEAQGYNSSVSGGKSNNASGDSSSVSGGSFRSVSGYLDWRAGNLFEDN